MPPRQNPSMRNEFGELGPQNLSHMTQYRCQQSLEGSFETRALSPPPTHDISAEAVRIFMGTLDMYRLPAFRNCTLQAKTPLWADALLWGLYRHASCAAGRIEVVRSCLCNFYAYSMPVSEPSSPKTSPALTPPLGDIVNHIKPIFHTIGSEKNVLDIVSGRLFHFAGHLLRACSSQVSLSKQNTG